MSSSGVTVIDEEYSLLSGKRLSNHNYCHQLSLTFSNKNGSHLEIQFRAYNDGVAFRYVFPVKKDTMHTITRELTGFNVPLPGKAWILPYDSLGEWSPAYESVYENEIEIGTPAPSTTGWAFPALMKIPGAWLLISESGLDETYCGSHLAAEAPDGNYSIEFPHEWESYGLGKSHPESTPPWQTPWRVIITGTSLGTIVESSLITHLAKPNQLQDTSWIQPGRASWSWWGDHASGSDYEKLKKYVDFAAEMGWEYSLVDADWHVMQGGSIEELIEYATSKNVGIWLWYNSGGPHTRVMNAGPRDLMYVPEIRKDELQKISKLGVKGIKVDFFQSDKQDIIKLYLDIARDAAENKIMLNTHGSTLPRGWNRTYPNFITMEGVRGAELYGWPGFSPQAVYLNAIYPYTRNVVGPMDYTPVTFSDYSEASKRLTTHAHELALSVVFESGVVHFADRIEGFMSVPEKVRVFLKEVPVTWDDIFFIDGYPGDLFVVARKKGEKYYVAGINGEQTGKTIHYKLPFLPEGNYNYQIFADGDGPRSFEIKEIDITPDTELTAELLPAGGFTGVVVPK